MSTVLREGATMWSIFFFFLQRKFSKAGRVSEWSGWGGRGGGGPLSLFSQSIFLIMPMTHLHIGRGEDAGEAGGGYRTGECGTLGKSEFPEQTPEHK